MHPFAINHDLSIDRTYPSEGIHLSILSTHLALTCSQTAVSLSDRGEALYCNCFALYCCSVLQRVAACRLVVRFVADFPEQSLCLRGPPQPASCSVLLQCVVLNCSVWPMSDQKVVAVCCSVLHCVAMCCSVLQASQSSHCVRMRLTASVLQCSAAVHCNMLQRVTLCCSVLQTSQSDPFRC